MSDKLERKAGKLSTDEKYGRYNYSNFINSLKNIDNNYFGNYGSKNTLKNLIDATNNRGSALSLDEFKNLKSGTGFTWNTELNDAQLNEVYKYYLQLVDDNANVFGFNSKGEKTLNDTTNRDVNFYNMLNESEQAMRDSMMLSPNDEQAQQYKQDMYGSLDAYEADLDASLAASEMSAYQQIGQQQLELENMIAEQRMKALKSGTTSAQLASQGLANMFAAQSGAAQVANNLLASRQQAANQIAQSRYGITQDMYNIINANQQTYASAKAQYAATMGNYAATVDQPYAQYNAWGALSALDKERLNTSYAKGK